MNRRDAPARLFIAAPGVLYIQYSFRSQLVFRCRAHSSIKNYGWPLVSFGNNYNGVPIPKPDMRPDLAMPAIYWVPVVAPGNLMFYRGTQTFPQWDGNGFISGMGTMSLNRVIFDGHGGAKMAERWAMGKRIRDVAEGPDGSLWLLEDANPGALIHVTPK